MATDPRRLPHQRIVREIDALHREAERTIARQVRAAILSGDLATAQRRRLQLAAVIATLDRLGAAVDARARLLVRDAVSEGAEVTARQIAGLRVTAPEIPGAFAGVSGEAVATLHESIANNLRGSRSTVGRQVADVYAREQRAATLRALLGADGSPRETRAELMRRLLQDQQVQRLIATDGVTGFIDRAGRRWTLRSYSDMAVRTVTREAVVQGQLARMAAHGINLARISKHGTTCDICRPWEGRLVSLDGTTSSYEGEAVATLGALPNGGPPFHPNCEHSLAPVAVRIERLARELLGAR